MVNLNHGCCSWHSYLHLHVARCPVPKIGLHLQEKLQKTLEEYVVLERGSHIPPAQLSLGFRRWTPTPFLFQHILLWSRSRYSQSVSLSHALDPFRLSPLPGLFSVIVGGHCQWMDLAPLGASICFGLAPHRWHAVLTRCSLIASELPWQPNLNGVYSGHLERQNSMAHLLAAWAASSLSFAFIPLQSIPFHVSHADVVFEAPWCFGLHLVSLKFA